MHIYLLSNMRLPHCYNHYVDFKHDTRAPVHFNDYHTCTHIYNSIERRRLFLDLLARHQHLGTPQFGATVHGHVYSGVRKSLTDCSRPICPFTNTLHTKPICVRASSAHKHI